MKKKKKERKSKKKGYETITKEEIRLDKISVMVVQSNEILTYFGASVLENLETFDIVLDQVTFADKNKLVYVIGKNNVVAIIYKLLKNNNSLHYLGEPTKSKKKTYFHIEKNINELTVLLAEAGAKVKYCNEQPGQMI